MPAGRPTGHVNIPAQVERIAAGQALQPVWENELGGVTFAVAGANPRFVKWAPAETTLNLTAEAARLRWARPSRRCRRFTGKAVGRQYFVQFKLFARRHGEAHPKRIAS